MYIQIFTISMRNYGISQMRLLCPNIIHVKTKTQTYVITIVKLTLPVTITPLAGTEGRDTRGGNRGGQRVVKRDLTEYISIKPGFGMFAGF